MVEIVPEPASVVINTAPGQPRTGGVQMWSVPPDPGVTATVEGDPAFRVTEVILVEHVLRPLSALEQAELLLNRRGDHQQVVPEITATTDGTRPLEVPTGEHGGPDLRVNVELAAGADPALAAATLVVTGTSWGRIEVPLLALRSTAAVPVQLVPDAVSASARPGDVLTPVVAAVAPEDATVLATLQRGTFVRIVGATAFAPVHRELTDDEIDRLEPHPPSIRADARRDGELIWLEAGRAAAGEPLAVPAGARYQVALEVTVPATGAPIQIVDFLNVHATTWQRASARIQIEIADLDVVPSADVVRVRQGEEGESYTVALHLRHGGATPVDFRVGPPGGPFRVEPTTVELARGEPRTVHLRISAAPDPATGAAPLHLGEYDAGLTVTAYGGTWVRELPLRLRFVPGSVAVVRSQSSVSGLQGQTATFAVQLVVGGGAKRVELQGARLPRGVRMDPLVATTTGPSSTPLALRFHVDRDAPPVQGDLVTVNWAADDGEHHGTVQVPFTVIRQPDTVTFNQRIVTPTGTALGGEAGFVLHNDGSGRFRGYLRATGWPSYSFRVRAMLRSADGLIALVSQRSGTVYGTDTPGPRQFDWADDVRSPFVAEQWPAVRTATLAVTKSYEMTGVLGTLADIVGDVAEFAALAVVTGTPLAAVLLVGTELADLADSTSSAPAGWPGSCSPPGPRSSSAAACSSPCSSAGSPPPRRSSNIGRCTPTRSTSPARSSRTRCRSSASGSPTSPASAAGRSSSPASAT